MKALVFALTVPVLGLAAATPAHAEVHVGVGIVLGQPSYRQGYGYGNSYGRGRADTARYGYDRGYREGTQDGYRDGERGHRFELYREGDYHDSDKGYQGWMGPRWEYSNAYRRGFEEGYRRAFAQGRRHDGRHDGYDRYDRDRDDHYDDDRDRSPLLKGARGKTRKHHVTDRWPGRMNPPGTVVHGAGGASRRLPRRPAPPGRTSPRSMR